MERIQDRPTEKQALTHYDDLGLHAAASGEEIREAYLNLVRLLHPDLQHEPALKRYAENQMQRVSRAYAVLSDTERRRRYDASLAGGGEKPAEPAASKRSVGRWRARALITLGWLICAFAGIVGIGWYFSQQAGESAEPAQVNAAPLAPAATRAAPVSNPAPPAADTTDKTLDPDALRSDLASAKVARDRALNQTVLQAKELDFLTNRILNPAQRPIAGSSRFSGVWVLPPSKVASVTSAFTPESVDLIMAARQGALEGRYRARYPSMGVPEPPMVHFYFEGKCQDDTANAAWNGEGGSKGEIQLKLTSDNALQLVWSVTDPGNQTGPATGTVALVRKREPQ
ncbi:MAG: J domain-containing protein [Acidobacteriia bacterium]|nr:J domain-containing protein [Terriglobia bacterium]